jgi:hypothetical protein
MSLNEIIFDHIDDKYAYGKYGEFTVIMMTANRYINATKLCKEYGKELKHWRENKASNDLIDEVEKEITAVDYPAAVNNAFIIVNTSNKSEKNKLISGTYVHELLIPHIASWISPQFGIKVSKIVNNFLITEYKNTIKDKDDKINELDKNIKELLEGNKKILNNHDLVLADNKKLLANNDEMKKILEANQARLDKTYDRLVGAHEEIRDIKDKLDSTEGELQTVNDKLDNTTEELDVIKDKLDIATDDRVVKTKSKTTLEYLIVLKTTDMTEKYKYYIIRCQKRSIKQRLEEKSNYTEIKRIECCPNSTNLYNRIKEKLKNNLDVRSNRINLIHIHETDFLNRINEINEEKKII